MTFSILVYDPISKSFAGVTAILEIYRIIEWLKSFPTRNLLS